MLNMRPKIYKNEYCKNEPIYYNYMNFKPISVKSRRRPAVAAASRSPAEEKASPLSEDGMNGY